MKSLGIPSLTSPKFKELVNDPLSFRIAIKNVIQDSYEQAQLISGLVNIAVTLFTGEQPRDPKSLQEKVREELHRRMSSDMETLVKQLPYLKLEK